MKTSYSLKQNDSDGKSINQHDVYKTWDLVTLISTTAVMLGCTFISSLAAVANRSYECTLSAGICATAFAHYCAILFTALNTDDTQDTVKHKRYTISCLR